MAQISRKIPRFKIVPLGVHPDDFPALRKAISKKMRALKNFLKTWLPERALLQLQAVDHYFNGEAELRLIALLCPPGRIAVDAGANIGIYSHFMRRYAKHVYAYEPNPELAARLARVMPDVTVRNVALSDKEGEVVLKIPLDKKGRMQHELASISQDFGESQRTFRVNATTVDSENLIDVGFIKVDVEQHEREVLRGALHTIDRWRPVILTEASPLKYTQGLRETFEFITGREYIGWFKFNHTWMPFHSLRDEIHANEGHFGDSRNFVGTNLLFFPADHALASSGPDRART